MSNRQRLDEALVARGLYESRSRARDAILRGTVSVDGETVLKPAQRIGTDAVIARADPAAGYVSRAALKLKHALARFAIPVRGAGALDIGASTGGFSQVLLEEGVAQVTAIDVGHGQMKLADRRLTVIEGLNARHLEARHLGHAVDVVVCDVSFISLWIALPPAMDFDRPGAVLVAMSKPQFEVGREAIGKGGIVADEAERQRACEDISRFIAGRGWSVLGLEPSPIEGADGNRAVLIVARKGAAEGAGSAGLTPSGRDA